MSQQTPPTEPPLKKHRSESAMTTALKDRHQLDSLISKTPEVEGLVISLTDKEQQIVETIRAVLKHFALKTTVRIAGGWVRDKLLGLESDDIDLALDDMMGEEFAKLINQFLTMGGQETHSVGVVKSNPDQSKHLETACMQLHGVWIDVNNLRTETYAADSRIPEMQLGSAGEDCLRRDLTINALFYNINTGRVEDFCGTGVSDLHGKIVRTPLPPVQTFRDDPLRVLRAVRFATRFGFQIVPALVSAASLPEVHSNLEQKVSRERIGIEVDKMLSSSRPGAALSAIEMLCQFGLFRCVFALPTNIINPECVPSAESAPELCLGRVRAMHAIIDSTTTTSDSSLYTPALTRLVTFASLLSPFFSARYKLKKKKTASAVDFIVRHTSHGKLNDDCAAVCLMLQQASEVRKLVTSSQQVCDIGERRYQVGCVVRDAKQFWAASVDLARISCDDESDDAQECVKLRSWVREQGLEDCAQWKPFFNGNEIMQEFGVKGKQIGQMTQKQIEWRLRNPQGTKSECGEYLRANHSAAASS